MKNLLATVAVLLPSVVFAADPDRGGDVKRGKEIAELQCAACHAVGRDRGTELAAAPPFEVIGRKVGFNERALTLVVSGPHPKMNFVVTVDVAADIAAYIKTLAP